MIRRLIAFILRFLTGANLKVVDSSVLNSHRHVYFANHTSHLDFLILWASLPLDIRCKTRAVAGKDYWLKNAFNRFLSQEIFNALLINRNLTCAPDDPKHPVNMMAEVVKREQCSLIVFPEGTRSVDGNIQPFKSGLYHLAQLCPDTDFIPVFLENCNRILPKGEFLPIPLIGCVTLGQPLRIKTGETKQEFLGRALKAIEALKG